MDNIKSDSYFVNLIKSDIYKISEYIKNVSFDDFMNDERLIDAVLFRMIQAIENIKKLSDTFKEERNDVKWNKIIGFRNRIVHDYGKTDYSIVYEVATIDLPELLIKL